MSRVYYNEIDPAAAHLLRCLIEDGVIALGDVDERSIADVQPEDLAGYTQCHFFAGGGLWSVAARLGGLADNQRIWTGSCPCQPFSVAGKGLGADDPRHLWPHFFRLIRACRPALVVGEQVAGAAGYGWFDGVAADLEGENYACRAVDIPACAIDAPHIRSRLYWAAVNMGDAIGAGLERYARNGDDRNQPGRLDAEPPRSASETGGGDGYMVNADSGATWVSRDARAEESARRAYRHDDDGRCNGTFWSDAEWLLGADGKARRVGTDFRFLVDGFSAGMGGLRHNGDDILQAAIAEVGYGQKEAFRPAEILRAVWNRVFSEPAPYEALGEQAGICQAEILLAFVCKLDGGRSEGDIPFSGSEELRSAMRSVRERTRHARSSYKWRRFEQRHVKHTDAVQALSWVLAQHAQEDWAAYKRENAAPFRLLVNNVPNRVASLRIAGNAIVPQVAAEVIGALMETLNG